MIYSALLFVLFFTILSTGFVIKYAKEKQMLDIPNHRSSHVIPTPRGGGVAFVFIFLSTILYLLATNTINFRGNYLLLFSMSLIAVVGFYDDRRNLSARWRFLFQFIAGIISMVALGFLPDIYIYNLTIHAGYLTNFLALVFLIWILNLYNFMDGIDGIAGLEAVSVCLGASVLFWITGNYNLTLVPLLLAMAATGFLFWNLPPAKIFMGDVGSSFLGFTFGLLTLQSLFVNPNFLWSWLILLGVFIVDASVTLVNRVIRREKLYLAHRSHAYQQAARVYNSHKVVSLSVVAVNLIWLCPLAILVGVGYIEGFLGLIISYIPLLILAIQFRAGDPS